MSPKVSEEYLLARRRQILDAAVISFSRLGFHETTLEHIREEAGLSRGAVYHYFKSKDEIIVALQEAWGEGDRLDLESAAEIDDPAASLQGLLNAVNERRSRPGFAAGNRLGIFLWAEALLNQGILDRQLALMAPWRDQVQALIGGAQKAGKFRRDVDPEGMAILILSAYIGLYMQLAWDSSLPTEKGWDALDALLVSATQEGAPVSEAQSPGP